MFRLPLSVTHDVDLQAQLSQWIDNNQSYGSFDVAASPIEFTSSECLDDLQHLAELRRAVCRLLRGSAQHDDHHSQGLAQLSVLQDYAAALAECLTRGFPATTTTMTASGNDDIIIRLGWKLQCEPDTAGIYQSSLLYERAHIIWNIAVLAAYKGTTAVAFNKNNSTPQQVAWKQAAGLWEQAAAILRYLQTTLTPELQQMTTSVLSKNSLQFWESWLCAQSQRAAYEMFNGVTRPKHFVLAKLATAALPILDQAEEAVNQILNQLEQAAVPETVFYALYTHWADVARAWNMYFTSLAEYHQGRVHAEKKEYGMQVARHQMAQRFATLCRDYCADTIQQQQQPQQLQQQPPNCNHDNILFCNLQPLQDRMESILAELPGLLDLARQSLNDVSIPEELPEIRPQLMVKMGESYFGNLPNVLPEKAGTPLFASIMDEQARTYVTALSAEMEQLMEEASRLEQCRTETAQKTLSTVNLPHSLMMRNSKDRDNGGNGGLPEHIWQRVERLQQERRVNLIKQETWELRDLAEQAYSLYGNMLEQLKENIEMDHLFREQHADFEGHDVQQVQGNYQQYLSNYHRLLTTAQESDKLLLERLELLETDPKFRLLCFPRAQLDCLLPAPDYDNDDEEEDDDPTVNAAVQALSQYLIQLSSLLEERQSKLKELRQKVKCFTLTRPTSLAEGSDLDAIYRQEVQNARNEWMQDLNLVRSSIEVRQSELLDRILKENEVYMQARRASAATAIAADSCLVKIQDALEEVDMFTKHLKDGRDFYNVMLPKLEKLKMQVGTVSARLTVERCEFEDRQRMMRQELEDARIAASWAADQQQQNPSGSRIPGQPGSVEQVSHDEPSVRVDDAKVANLVAMDFDPEKVVEALNKYDNDMERALNDLLSG